MTVLRPEVKKPHLEDAIPFEDPARVFWSYKWYVQVPRVLTYGTFRVLDMLSMEELAKLFVLEKKLKG